MKPRLIGKPDAQIVGGDDNWRILVFDDRRALRLGGEQRLRIRMARRGEDARHIAAFDNVALLHHANRIGEAAHEIEVMGDEQDRHAIGLLQAFQQGDDLRLHGDVERGRRLVGDEQIGLVGERHGDHDALALAAGKLMRIGAEPGLGIGDADLVEEFDDACAHGVAAAHAMKLQNLGDLLLDRLQRIERGHRLLEDHGDARAANGAQLGLADFQHVPPVEQRLRPSRWRRAAAGGRWRAR